MDDTDNKREKLIPGPGGMEKKDDVKPLNIQKPTYEEPGYTKFENSGETSPMSQTSDNNNHSQPTSSVFNTLTTGLTKITGFFAQHKIDDAPGIREPLLTDSERIKADEQVTEDEGNQTGYTPPKGPGSH